MIERRKKKNLKRGRGKRKGFKNSQVFTNVTELELSIKLLSMHLFAYVYLVYAIYIYIYITWHVDTLNRIKGSSLQSLIFSSVELGEREKGVRERKKNQ